MNLLQQLSGVGQAQNPQLKPTVRKLRNGSQTSDRTYTTDNLQGATYNPIQGATGLPLQYQGASANIYGVQPQKVYDQQQTQVGVTYMPLNRPKQRVQRQMPIITGNSVTGFKPYVLPTYQSPYNQMDTLNYL